MGSESSCVFFFDEFETDSLLFFSFSFSRKHICGLLEQRKVSSSSATVLGSSRRKESIVVEETTQQAIVV